MHRETQEDITRTKRIITINNTIAEMTKDMPPNDPIHAQALLLTLRDYNLRCQSYIALLQELDIKNDLIDHLCQLLLELGLTPPTTTTKPSPN